MNPKALKLFVLNPKQISGPCLEKSEDPNIFVLAGNQNCPNLRFFLREGGVTKFPIFPKLKKNPNHPGSRKLWTFSTFGTFFSSDKMLIFLMLRIKTFIHMKMAFKSVKYHFTVKGHIW